MTECKYCFDNIDDEESHFKKKHAKRDHKTGKLIKTLTTNKQSAGQGIVQWNGRNDTGISLPSGVYFYQLSSADFTATRKIVLLK